MDLYLSANCSNLSLILVWGVQSLARKPLSKGISGILVGAGTNPFAFVLIKGTIIQYVKENRKNNKASWTSSLNNLPSCTALEFEMSKQEQLGIQAENPTSCTAVKCSDACINLTQTSVIPKYDWVDEVQRVQQIYQVRGRRNYTSFPDHSMPGVAVSEFQNISVNKFLIHTMLTTESSIFKSYNACPIFYMEK